MCPRSSYLSGHPSRSLVLHMETCVCHRHSRPKHARSYSPCSCSASERKSWIRQSQCGAFPQNRGYPQIRIRIESPQRQTPQKPLIFGETPHVSLPRSPHRSRAPASLRQVRCVPDAGSEMPGHKVPPAAPGILDEPDFPENRHKIRLPLEPS